VYVGTGSKIVGHGCFNGRVTRRAGICPSGDVGEQPHFSANSEGPDGIFGQHITDIQMAIIAGNRERAALA